MANHYKALLLDVDGTLVASRAGAQPSARVIAAVKAAQAKVHVGLATGRPLHFARPIIEVLDLHGPSVFNGGAEVIDVTTDECLHRQVLSVESLQELVRLALPFGYKVYDEKENFTSLLERPEQVNTVMSKLFIEAVKHEDAVPMLEVLAAVEGTQAHPTTSWGGDDVVDIQVTHEHATKRYGIEKLLNTLELSSAQAVGIGDGYNDVPLLEAVGFKVVMGDAPDEVKALADYVAPSLQDDGVADAIERYILS